MWRVQLPDALLWYTMRQREPQIFLDQLLNVWAFDIGILLNFNNLENL